MDPFFLGPGWDSLAMYPPHAIQRPYNKCFCTTIAIEKREKHLLLHSVRIAVKKNIHPCRCAHFCTLSTHESHFSVCVSLCLMLFSAVNMGKVLDFCCTKIRLWHFLNWIFANFCPFLNKTFLHSRLILLEENATWETSSPVLGINCNGYKEAESFSISSFLQHDPQSNCVVYLKFCFSTVVNQS